MSNTSLQNFLLLAARIIMAIVIGYAGYGKFFLWSMDPATLGMVPWLYNMMLFLSIAELVAAVAFLLGFLSRTACLCMTIVLIGAVFVSKYMMGIPFVTATSAGWNFPFGLIAPCLLLIVSGPGAWSIEGMWHRRLNSPLVA